MDGWMDARKEVQDSGCKLDRYMPHLARYEARDRDRDRVQVRVGVRLGLGLRLGVRVRLGVPRSV